MSKNLTPVDIDSVWPEAEPLICHALRDSTSTAEEVHEACRQGLALMVASERIFVVIEPIEADGLHLNIWCAASRGSRSCINSHMPEIEACARAMGAKTVLFKTSPRKAYERILPEGWKARQVTWAKEI